MGWIGGITASKQSFLKVLAAKRSAGTFIDGIHGMFACGQKERDARTEVLFIKQRKGFAKLALQTGTPLVPCYAFGQTKICSVAQDPLGVMQWLSRRLKTSILIPVGVRAGPLPFRLPIPRRSPLTLVMGDPIAVEMAESPTAEQVDALHAQLLAGVEGGGAVRHLQEVGGLRGVPARDQISNK
jgi:2-acylglycerol O-acyltransferase 2